MSRQRLFTVLLSFSWVVLIAAPSVAAGKKKAADKPDPSLGAVEQALRAEIAGQVDRRGELTVTVKKHPNSPAARWQAGYVRDGDGWRSFDDPAPATTAAELLEQYRGRRDKAPSTFAGQMDLANWCRKEGLKDQERAHSWTVLGLAPDAERPAILKRLGYLPFENRWLHREDLSYWRERNEHILAALNRWGQRMEKIAEQLDGSPRQQEAALANLKQLGDPDSIPAIEYVLCGRENAADAAIDALARIPGIEATVALANQATFSKWPEVRRKSAHALKSLRFEDFVPELIALLVSPATMTHSSLWYYSEGPRGNRIASIVLVSGYLIALETENQFQVKSLQTVDYRLNELIARGEAQFLSSDTGRGFSWTLAPRDPSAGQRRQLENARAGSDQAFDLQKRVDSLNERIEELNHVIIDVLAAVSGREPTSDPGKWWQWWSDYTDTTRIGDKAVVVEVNETVVGDPTIRFRRASCFAAGTPVWTETGALAIETIKVGDRVLAKDIETGKLSYKPVLQTTVRPPKELTTLRFGDETIVCTGGHRFWNSGSGWLKARDLAPQTLLHTVTGNTPVWSAKKGTTAETYNLVVADFHTYFVGKTGVLCQDLLIPKGTNNVVPGLPRAQAVAQK